MSGVYRATWTAIVSALSTDVVARLAAAGLPPLTPEIDGTPGAIQLGPQFVCEQSSPPRIVMIPDDFDFETSRDVVSPNGRASGNRTWDPRAIGVQWKRYQVQCWGCNYSDQTTPAPDPALDYDAAQILCEMVWQSAQAIAAGVWRTTKGTLDRRGLVRMGRVITFDLSFSTPAPDVRLPYAPHGVNPNPTTEIIVSGHTPVPP